MTFIFSISFFLGDLFLQTFHTLPSMQSILIYCVLALFISLILRLTKINDQYGVLGFLCGFLWASWYASCILSWSLPGDLEGKSVIITGLIASIPIEEQGRTHFLFSLREFNHQPVKTLLQLSIKKHLSHIKVGDQWQLCVKLKSVHGTQNPGSFDYEAWAFQKGLRANGVIQESKLNHFIDHHLFFHPLEQIRQFFYTRIQFSLPHSARSPWLLALMMGERHQISPNDWQVLRHTGTNHLMAIAGLHIGILVTIVHLFVSWMWKRSSTLMLKMPAKDAGYCAGFVVAFFYSALAGFSIPTQRAWIMLSVFTYVKLTRRKVNAWHIWCMTLFLVLLLNPIDILTESFWLSFVTIALIIYGMSGRLQPSGWWWRWGRVQWVLGLGLIPLSLYFFQESSLISFIANCVAIPWLGCLLLPLCFLAIIFIATPFLPLLLSLADKVLAVLWVVLSYFSQLPFSVYHFAIPNIWICVLTLLAGLLLLIPTGLPGRWLGLFWLIPLLAYYPAQPKYGEMWLTVLDVGQGLSAVIQTQNHILVYDAGPKLSSTSDMGERVVVPYLYTIMNSHKLDLLVVSHGDNDHIGGSSALLESFTVRAIKTSVPERFNAASYCLAGDNWQWDGVRFTFLHPLGKELNLGNNSSCVLRVDNGAQSILLTGDIEKLAERNLLKRQSIMHADILIAPHHGSKTSAIPDFVSHVSPHIVFYATGFNNQYGFPHESVISAYSQINALQINTAVSGAIKIKIGNNIQSLEQYRVDRQKYWQQ